MLQQILKVTKIKKNTKINIVLDNEMIDILLNYNIKTIEYLLSNLKTIDMDLSIKILKSISKFSKVNCHIITNFLETQK